MPNLSYVAHYYYYTLQNKLIPTGNFTDQPHILSPMTKQRLSNRGVSGIRKITTISKQIYRWPNLHIYSSTWTAAAWRHLSGTGPMSCPGSWPQLQAPAREDNEYRSVLLMIDCHSDIPSGGWMTRLEGGGIKAKGGSSFGRLYVSCGWGCRCICSLELFQGREPNTSGEVAE